MLYLWVEYIEVDMIFVTLGSQNFQFNRLLKAIDELVSQGKCNDEIFAQTGYSDYEPQNYKYKKFLDREEFSDMQEKADIVITHGGTGAIIGALKKGKKVIAVPRLCVYGEHVDDHQLQLVGQFEELNLIYQCKECSKRDEAIKYVRNHEYEKYHSNTDNFIRGIDEFITQTFS